MSLYIAKKPKKGISTKMRPILRDQVTDGETSPPKSRLFGTNVGRDLKLQIFEEQFDV